MGAELGPRQKRPPRYSTHIQKRDLLGMSAHACRGIAAPTTEGREVKRHVRMQQCTNTATLFPPDIGVDEMTLTAADPTKGEATHDAAAGVVVEVTATDGRR